MGPPGAGKGTQAARFCLARALPHLSTGDMFRDHIRRGTDLGQEAQDIMETGALVPDELVSRLVDDRLGADDCCAGHVLDGYPRTHSQVTDLDAMLKRRNWRRTAVLLIDVPEDELVGRIAARRTCEACGSVTTLFTTKGETCPDCGGCLSQRADDDEPIVRQRLSVYRDETKPVLDIYEERQLLVTIDGRGPVEVVAVRIAAAVDQVAA